MSDESEVLVARAKFSTDTIIHGLGAVTFWGAQTYMYVNIVHFIACIAVVVIYCTLPISDKNLYNRIVLRHNVSLLILGGILTLLGFCQLIDDCNLPEIVIRLAWLNLQYFTIATVFWLNVVCLDMTLVITRLCWIRRNGCRYDDDRKLAIYSMLVWGGALAPTLTAAVFEFAPQVPRDYPLKANFTEASRGPRPIVNMYFFLLPACTLFCNNLLFALTTCSIIRVQRSTQVAAENRENLLRKKYFLFLRLYLFMGAPWFFGAVLACLNQLVLLKVCRTLQPVLWLVMLVSRKKISLQLKRKFGCKRGYQCDDVQSRAVADFEAKDNVSTAKVARF